jgi:hypothetical protein
MEFFVIHHAARWAWWPVQRRRCWFLSADFLEYANKVVEDRIGLMPWERFGRFCTAIQSFPRASIRSEDTFLRLSPEPAESETSTLIESPSSPDSVVRVHPDDVSVFELLG